VNGQPVALVLSGGGAKTAAHVGAARALAEAGLAPAPDPGGRAHLTPIRAGAN
jgi:hypothetical protein